MNSTALCPTTCSPTAPCASPLSIPLDPRSLDAARDYFGKNIIVCITRVSQLDDVLAKRKEELRVGNGADLNRLNIVEIANSIVLAAFKRGASDIHVEPMADRLRVRFREDGVMVHFRDYPIGAVAPLVSRFKIMCGADIAEKRRHQDGRLIFNHMGVQIDLRMSFYVTVYGEQIVMRLLKNQEELLPMHELGMLPGMLDRFMEEALDAPSGVIMVTGPTGSGKSTTVYSCINYLNRPEVSIITAEDPVEYKVRGIGQCSIMPSIGLTFEETLKHIVRQDPDIVVIGEVRDHFSAEMCIQTALTGHKVLTTFHTEDSIGALVRLLDMNIEPFLVSSTLSCILSQRLVRRVCPHCAVPYQPDLSQLRRMGCTYGDLAGAEFRKGRGCAACRHSGYKGQAGHLRDAHSGSLHPRCGAAAQDHPRAARDQFGEGRHGLSHGRRNNQGGRRHDHGGGGPADLAPSPETQAPDRIATDTWSLGMFEIASIHDRVREFLDEPGSDLPVFDRTALLVHQEATKADPDTDKVISYIVQDQVLVAEVLKVANSSFFRGIKKISRIQDAVVRIGLREVVNCVMMATQRKNYSSRNPFVQQYTATLWKHSVACAYGAQWLAKRCNHAELAPEAFIAGLLHDVGKLLVLKALVSVSERDKEAPRITKTAADEFLDTMHPECGFLLLEKWNLPESYCQVCRDHHRRDYDQGNSLLSWCGWPIWCAGSSA
jgi:type II secretory ATPase GspE/PulE/Tfp pilus assembly ATPase PilB-like protein/HD-like signal output (HDOD) protein